MTSKRAPKLHTEPLKFVKAKNTDANTEAMVYCPEETATEKPPPTPGRTYLVRSLDRSLVPLMRSLPSCPWPNNGWPKVVGAARNTQVCR